MEKSQHGVSAWTVSGAGSQSLPAEVGQLFVLPPCIVSIDGARSAKQQQSCVLCCCGAGCPLHLLQVP